MITGKTAVYALLGHPVTHSLSPQMHAGWMADHGLDATYVALPIDPSAAPQAFAAVRAVGIAGANITVPFKELAAAAADERSPEVERLGAANVFARRNGSLIAHNTDIGGFVGSLDEAAPGWRSRVRRALVLGAGGAARGILWGLAAAGVPDLTVCNRTAARAHETAALAPGTRVAEWSELRDAFAHTDLIVNATSLGMGGNDPDWPLDAAQAGTIVADAVYAPLETGLLRTARARGLVAVDGLGMLIHQGALAFEIWFGVKPDTGKARTRLLAAL